VKICAVTRPAGIMPKPASSMGRRNKFLTRVFVGFQLSVKLGISLSKRPRLVKRKVLPDKRKKAGRLEEKFPPEATLPYIGPPTLILCSRQ